VVEGASWWRISNAAGDGGAPARVDIYDEIGWYGVTASAFVAQLNEITAGSIELHINSPGGDVYDGIAIYNALLDHPADVEVRVDGLAASAASFIAQAGDRVVMGRNSEMMIHDALGMTIGNAADHRAMAEMLDAASDNLASIYAARAGNGGVKSWRKRMEDETWYTADEAVAAGLADSVSATPRRRGEAAASAEPVWDLSVFKHSNRQEAGPPPGVRPRAEEAKCSKCGAELTDAQKAKGFCSECDESLEDAVTDAKCPDCGADVPDGATSCPDCGASMREDESDLTDLLDSLPELDVKAMHLAMIDAADEAGLDVDTTALRASLEGDWTFDPDVFRATLLEELEAPAHAVEPPPVPTPTTIRIDAVADALRGALQP
jgi:ATP-dependent Clp endopeptidase proteolytic subunit ClpP